MLAIHEVFRIKLIYNNKFARKKQLKKIFFVCIYYFGVKFLIYVGA